MAKALKKLKLNSKGFTHLLNSGEIRKDLEGRARRIENSLPTNDGEEWDVSVFQGGDRTNAVIRTKNQAARKSSAEDNALMRGLGAGS